MFLEDLCDTHLTVNTGHAQAPSYPTTPNAVGGGHGGREPGRIGSRRGTGGAKEKGRKREFKDGGMRE